MGKPWLSRAAFAGSLGMGLAACTALTGVGDLVVGDAPDGADASEASVPVTPTATVTAPTPGPPDAGDNDASVLGVDATVVDACSATGCAALPTNFVLAALGPRNAACPAGFEGSTDLVETPSLDPGACTCGCTTTAQPTCTVDPNAPVEASFGQPGNNCNQSSSTIPARCDTTGFNGPFPAQERRYSGVIASLTGGNCSGDPVKNNSKLKTAQVRLCQATVVPQCEGKTCVPEVPAPYAACIAATGDVACPSDWPDRHLTGTSASFSCTDNCGCSLGGACPEEGTMAFFTNGTCAGAPAITFAANGDCKATPGSGGVGMSSHRYDPAPPSGVSCSPSGTAPAVGPTLAQRTTVCCK